MTTRIPRDISSGKHFLLLVGLSIVQIDDNRLVVNITVSGAGTMPPTDTASAG